MRDQSAFDESSRIQMLSDCNKLILIAEHSKDVLWMMDGECKLIYVSGAIQELTGFTVAEVLAASPSSYYSERTIDRMNDWRRLIADPETTNLNNFTLDVELLHKNGRPVACELKASLVRSSFGKVVGIVGITRDVSLRKQAEAELTKLTVRDSLTSAYNKTFFYSQVQHEIERARRYKRPLCALMFDLDHFKLVNDTYGHAAGDLVLASFSQACMYSLRSYTIFGRLGGEEFGTCLQEASLHEAQIIAERLRATAENLEISFGSKGVIRITVSIGIAAWQGDANPEDLMARADAALYIAKAHGRNRVEIAPLI